MNARLSSFTMEDEPAANLRQLLYGADWGTPKETPSSTSIADGQKLLNFNNFLASFDQAFDVNTENAAMNESFNFATLVNKQDRYIEQLENENRIIKKQMESLREKVLEVVKDNQGLFQERRTELLNTMTAEPTSKGLSDEEKMFEGGRDISIFLKSRDEEFIRKIKHLESEIISLKEDQKSDVKPETNLNFLQRENHELHVKISQLEDLVNKLKLREDEAEMKIRDGIVLVEQAQMEKAQAHLERNSLRESFEKQQIRFENLVSSYEQKIAEEKEKQNKLHESQMKEYEREVKSVTDTTITLQANLEKSEREKLDLRSQLQRLSSQLDNIQTEYHQTIEKYQEQVTKALLELNQATENAAQMKMSNERLKLEHQKEVQWMRMEIEGYRKKLEEAERDQLRAKGEVNKLQQAKKLLQQQIEHTKAIAEEEVSANREDFEDINKYSRQREDQLRKLTDETKQKYIARYVEVESLLKQQIELGKKLRAECHFLEQKMQQMSEFHKNNQAEVGRKNEDLLEKWMICKAQCEDVGKILEKCIKEQVQLKQQLQQSRMENSTKTEQIRELLSQQQMLLKERHLLQEELRILAGNIQSEEKQS